MDDRLKLFLPMVVDKIIKGAEYNPACFDFSEEEAREKRLWRSSDKMPTKEELKLKFEEIKVEVEEIEKKSRIDDKIYKANLDLNKFLIMLIEDDNEGIKDFKEKWKKIKEDDGKEEL